MLNLILIAGLWTTTCIQTQMGGLQGYVQESYAIEENGSYEFTRDWYQDPLCTVSLETETESGSIKLGKKLSGMFTSGNTYEADFTNIMGTDLGAIQSEGQSLKVARGMKNSSFRNTMIGLFEYRKN